MDSQALLKYYQFSEKGSYGTSTYPNKIKLSLRHVSLHPLSAQKLQHQTLVTILVLIFTTLYGLIALFFALLF